MRLRGTVGVLLVLAACAQPAPSAGDPALDAGRETFNRLCASCHGGNGQGASAPALHEVLSTFTDCATHQRWVTLGSQRWQEEVGETYGDTNKEITAIMPAFEGLLTSEEIAQVAAYERRQFGGASAADALAGCGL